MKMQNRTSKLQTVREGNIKCTSFRMCLNLNDYQFKASIKFWINVLELHSNHKPKQYIRFTKNKKQKGTQIYYKSSKYKRKNKKKK